MGDMEELSAFGISELLGELHARAHHGKVRKELLIEGSSVMGIPRDDLLEPILATETPSVLSRFDSDVIVRALRLQEKVIYGTDDRQDLYELHDERVGESADGIVALFRSADVSGNRDGTSTLDTREFGSARKLCDSEPFRDQPIGAFCSGFLVAPDVIATAGHCAGIDSLADIRFVFGFRMINSNAARTRIQNAEIYRGARIIGRALDAGGSDWCLVRLDRAVTGHRVLPIRRTGRVQDGAAVYVIGHPSGLPLKYAGGAAVRDNTPAAFFVANLDTYGGNSGSPVFNAETHVVEGVLARGENDFIPNGDCNVSRVCPNTGCRGEECTRLTEFAQLVPM